MKSRKKFLKNPQMDNLRFLNSDDSDELNEGNIED
jgi:hypothetical protein